MAKSLPEDVLTELRRLEHELHDATRAGEVERGIEIATSIQALFSNDRRHHRLLRAKLWAFEGALDDNRLHYAESGFRGIRQLAASTTRLHLEASSLLAICLLRQKKIPEAKRLIRGVIHRLNNIQSDRTRRQFQRRLVDRMEEECILVELSESGQSTMSIDEVHDKAVLLLRQSSDSEILGLIGNTVPASGIRLLREVRDYSVKLLPPADRKLLPSPEEAERPTKIGKRAFALVRRIAWRAFCRPDSEIYRLWSKKIPRVFNREYFSAALTASLLRWKIGIPLLASGVVALIMKETAEHFCQVARPKGMMIDRAEPD